MLRIIAVDDEAVHLTNLIGVIQMLKPGYIIFSAKDGVQALEIIKSFQVDLLITDIRMPNMDGLTLIREAKKLYPELYTVILSGFGEFDYAKKAIDLGVDGYLLKILEQEELLKIMEDLESRLYDRQEMTRSKKTIHQDRMERDAELYVMGHLRTVEPELLQTVVGPYDSGIVFCAKRRVKRWDKENASFWMARLSGFLAEWAGSYTFRCQHQEGAVVTVLHCHKALPEEFYRRLREFCKNCSQLDFTIGVSEFFSPLSQRIELAFHQATEVCECSFYEPSAVLHRYSQATAMQPFLLGHIRLPLKESRELLMEGHAAQAADLLTQEARTYIQQHRPYPSKFKEVLMFCFWRICGEMGSVICKEDMQRLMIFIDQMISAAPTMQALESATQSICDQFCSTLKQQRKTITDQVMETAAKIISEEYARDWSLDELAERLHFNPSYFSTLFKQRFGMGYSDYLNEVRMERAAKALRSGNVRVGVLAEMVGYRNPTYFIKLFRKKYGVTPNEYKRGIVDDSQASDNKEK